MPDFHPGLYRNHQLELWSPPSDVVIQKCVLCHRSIHEVSPGLWVEVDIKDPYPEACSGDDALVDGEARHAPLDTPPSTDRNALEEWLDS